MTTTILDLSIIIPFKDKTELTIPCVESLLRYGPAVKQILLISNNSSDATNKRIQELIDDTPNAKLLIHNTPFNFQEINNWAIRQSTGKVAMMLNNDIELTEKSVGLLEHMYSLALKKTSGAIGCTLLYEDQRTIQHAGVYLVQGGTADHVYIGKRLEHTLQMITSDPSYVDIRKDVAMTAVTAAAVMVERKKFDAIDGLNEDFIICGGDVDLCLRLREAGLTNMLAGCDNGYMIHKESKSRSMLSVPYVDFVESYRSYVKHFSITDGDPTISKEQLSRV